MSIFKACDIRGIYGKELDELQAFEIGRAFGTFIDGKNAVVGGDARISTPLLKEKVIEGLLLSGCDVIDIGIVPTPTFYFAKTYLNIYGGVMVTASHNPSEYNGFKIAFGDLPVTEEDIKKIENLVKTKNFKQGRGKLIDRFVLNEYENYIQSFFTSINNSLKVVVDGGNGIAGPTAVNLFRKLNYEVETLFCEPDGTFPNREPNPAVEKNLEHLKRKVVKVNANFGVAFDGDGDRVAFVDENGKVIPSEKIIIIFAKYLFKKYGPGKIIYDHKCSTIVEKEIRKLGGEAVREKSGHAFIKRSFLQQNAVMAGEISGHYFFKELSGDDGIFSALLMGEIINTLGKKLSELANEIPNYYITPDIRIAYPYDKEKLFEMVKKEFSEYTIDTLDGVRVIFPNGWGLIRLSVTEPIITMRFEGDTPEDLIKIKELFKEKIPTLKELI